MEDNMQDTYTSSRWTSGNFCFPDTVTLSTDGIHYTKRRLFGSNEEVISYRGVASVKINSSLFFATVTIETTGGSQPVIINGLPKDAAKNIRETVRIQQSR